MKKLYYFIASFNAFPAENLGVFLAAIFIGSPVRGFLPFRAFLFETENVPKPTRVTLFPFFRDFVIAPMKEFKALSADAFDTSASFAILSTSSAFVIEPPLNVSKKILLFYHIIEY